ncbi:DUF3341 domain-containing protein [Chloroflexus sp.]|uniref:DUF3341 domain-containing protein n=1 Tax=Chloroflexus sp. TaxID=1904827 RepID=UPI003D148AD1
MRNDVYGVMAEFPTPEALIEATRKAKAAGYTKMDAFSPFPIEEVIEEIAHGDTGVPRLVLLFGLIGAATGFILQYIGNLVNYPLNIGGRPLDITNWPAMIPITFESGILLASFASAIGMVVLNGLPAPYHPVFNVPRFQHASQDAFFLCIESTDPLFDRSRTSQFLRSLNPMQVSEVPY